MKAWEELESLGIERCEECKCAVGTDWGYVDFTNKTVSACPQCGTFHYLEDYRLSVQTAKRNDR